jgi:hypothetical protein
MITMELAKSAAMAVPENSEAHRLAAELCAAHGVDPEHGAFPNWRREIAEQLVRKSLDAHLPPA